MHRRALLASTATSSLAAASAGCLASDDTDDATDPTTDDRSATTTRTDTTSTDTTAGPRVVEVGDTVDIPGTTVQVGFLDVQASFVERLWPSWDAHGTSDHQYLALDVSGADRAPDLAQDPPVSARVDGDLVATDREAYAKFDGQQPVGFAAPIPHSPDAESAAIVLHGTDADAVLRLDDDQLERVRDPPVLDVTPRIPDTVEGGPLQYELDVENTGGSPGTLVATSTHDAIHDAWWTRGDTVAPGDTETIAFEPYGPTEGDGYELEVVVDWGLDSITRTITIESSDDTTTD